MQVKISPSILSADFARLGEEVTAVSNAGADYIHLDVMDGHFVPNLTFGPQLITAIRKYSDLPFDVHLMIENPEHYISQYAAVGADIITIHYEAVIHLDRALAQIRQHKVKAGIALVPSTPHSVLEYLLPHVDSILIMTVNPGFGGQSFLTNQLNKIAAVRKMIDAVPYDIDLAVDGGITPQTAKLCISAGANVLVAGQAIFKEQKYAANIASLRDIS